MLDPTLPTGDVGRARANIAALTVLNDLDNDATADDLDDEQRAALAAWCGWGPMAKVLDPRETEQPWASMHHELVDLIGDVGSPLFTAARNAVTTAFYTPKPVMDAIWQIITDYGTPDGPVLEPGCGSGRFMAVAPSQYRMVGVEADPTSARIASLLNPDAVVHTSKLEKQELTGRFVAAVGNVPFENIIITDPRFPKGLSLHNYFLWRAVQSVLPGGLVVALTSHYTLDAHDNVGRKALAESADLIGAIRLPSNGMKAAGTGVIADLLVLRRRYKDEDADDLWVDDHRRDLAPPRPDDPTIGTWQRPIVGVHGVFEDPSLVLGNMHAVRAGRYNSPEIVVDAPVHFDQALQAAVTKIGRRLAGMKRPPAPIVADDAPLVPADDPDLDPREGAFVRHEGKMFQVQHGRRVPVSRRSKELNHLVSLRDMVVDLIDADADRSRSDESLVGLRKITRAIYDQYVENFGPLNRCSIVEGRVDSETGLPVLSRRRPSMGGFRSDPDYVTVLSIEHYDDDTGDAKPGGILLGRVNRDPDPVDSVDTIAEAVAVSMDQYGAVVPRFVAKLLGIDESEAEGTLHTSGDAYLNPVTGRWEPAGEYLSGNVRAKFAEAEEAAAKSTRFQANVDALRDVVPADLLPQEIKVRLGAPWVAPTIVRKFIAETLQEHEYDVVVEHQPEIAAWQLIVDAEMRKAPNAKSRYGTGRADAYQLIELALNGSRPIVYDTIEGPDGKPKKVRNVEETLLAVEKQRELHDLFTDWVWQDADRTEHLARLYNDTYNSIAPRVYTGEGLSFPGLSAAFTPYSSQREMVHRILSSEATLCGHSVGGGKTAIMFMSAMKMRQLGMVNKPMIVVPNHLVEQVAREGKALYPTARVLMASKEDTTKERRRLFAAKIATGDWDVVVMPHSSFTTLAVSDASQQTYLETKIGQYEVALLKGEGQTTNPNGSVSGGRTFKSIAKSLKTMEARLSDLLEHRTDSDTTVNFERLGCDYLFVDEAHYFKNLDFPTRVQGLSLSGSKRAADLEMKLWWLRSNRKGKTCTLLTGTPVSNTLAEMFVLQTYLSPHRLSELRIDMFDAWAAMFIEFESKIEVAPDGGSFRMHTRPSRFCNVPELMTEFGEYSDVRDRDALGIGGPETVEASTKVIDRTPELREYVDSLVERAERIRGGSVPKEEDNMLLVCTDGRKAALDLALVGVVDSDPDEGKVGEVSRNVLRVWNETKHNEYLDQHGRPSDRRGGMQIVFCDLGTPKPSDSQVYGKIRSRIIEGGIPAEQVRFIHEAATDAAKAALFADCRAGKVAVLMGSTDKLGVGTNVQDRCVAIHHVDAPWRPSDVEQREGRGNRPGNQNMSLYVWRYVREGSFDAYMWQTLERKARFIAQLFSGALTDREVEDVGETTLTYTEVKALATGNPLVLEHAEAVSKVSRLVQLERGHARNQADLVHRAKSLRARADATEMKANVLAEMHTRSAGHAAEWDLGVEFDDPEDRTEIGRVIADKVRAVSRRAHKADVVEQIGSYRGLPIVLKMRRTFGIGGIDAVMVAPGNESVNIETLNAEWVKSAQVWRFTEAIRSAYDSLEERADELFMSAARNRQVADEAEATVSPFDRHAELEAAVQRKREIEAEMAEGAAEHAAAAAGSE